MENVWNHRRAAAAGRERVAGLVRVARPGDLWGSPIGSKRARGIALARAGSKPAALGPDCGRSGLPGLPRGARRRSRSGFLQIPAATTSVAAARKRIVNPSSRSIPTARRRRASCDTVLHQKILFPKNARAFLILRQVFFVPRLSGNRRRSNCVATDHSRKRLVEWNEIANEATLLSAF